MHACAMHAVRHACSRRAMQQQQQQPFFLLAAGLRSAGRASARNGRSEGGRQPGCMVHGAQPMHVVCFMVLVVLGAAPPPIGSSLKREFWPRKFPAPSCLPRPVPLVQRGQRGVGVSPLLHQLCHTPRSLHWHDPGCPPLPSSIIDPALPAPAAASCPMVQGVSVVLGPGGNSTLVVISSAAWSSRAITASLTDVNISCRGTLAVEQPAVAAVSSMSSSTGNGSSGSNSSTGSTGSTGGTSLLASLQALAAVNASAGSALLLSGAPSLGNTTLANGTLGNTSGGSGGWPADGVAMPPGPLYISSAPGTRAVLDLNMMTSAIKVATGPVVLENITLVNVCTAFYPVQGYVLYASYLLGAFVRPTYPL